jgi:hypothetical protein
MTALAEQVRAAQHVASTATIDVSDSDKLSQICVGCQLRLSRWGGSKALSADQNAEIASTAGTTAKRLSASKRLYDSKHPAIRKVNEIINQAEAYWKSMTLPYVEPGVRLLRHDLVLEFEQTMRRISESLTPSLENLQANLGEIREQAQQELGTLFNAQDFPNDVRGLYRIAWNYPNTEPPNYLAKLSPEIYQQEVARVRQRFDDTVELALGSFTTNFKEVLERIAEQLAEAKTPGRKKAFYESSVDHLKETVRFFREQIAPLSLHRFNDSKLDEVVTQAENLFSGFTNSEEAAKEVRNSTIFRDEVKDLVDQMQTSLEGLITDAPLRKINRRRIA